MDWQLQDLSSQQHDREVEVDQRQLQLTILQRVTGLPGLGCRACTGFWIRINLQAAIAAGHMLPQHQHLQASINSRPAAGSATGNCNVGEKHVWPVHGHVCSIQPCQHRLLTPQACG